MSRLTCEPGYWLVIQLYQKFTFHIVIVTFIFSAFETVIDTIWRSYPFEWLMKSSIESSMFSGTILRRNTGPNKTIKRSPGSATIIDCSPLPAPKWRVVKQDTRKRLNESRQPAQRPTPKTRSSIKLKSYIVRCCKNWTAIKRAYFTCIKRDIGEHEWDPQRGSNRVVKSTKSTNI